MQAPVGARPEFRKNLNGTVGWAPGTRPALEHCIAMTQRTQRRLTRRLRGGGFTLVELLITVAIVGVLSALAIVGYNRYVRSAASGEAKAMLQNIRGAQDNYRAETLSYLSCSGDFAGGNSYHPRALGALDDRKASFITATPLNDCFRQLNVRASAPVRYSYAVRAGQPGPIAENNPPDAPGWPYGGGAAVSVDPWFIAVAAGDYDDDSSYSILYTSSIQTEVAIESEME